jgi:hypothetical protein
MSSCVRGIVTLQSGHSPSVELVVDMGGHRRGEERVEGTAPSTIHDVVSL